MGTAWSALTSVPGSGEDIAAGGSLLSRGTLKPSEAYQEGSAWLRGGYSPLRSIVRLVTLPKWTIAKAKIPMGKGLLEFLSESPSLYPDNPARQGYREEPQDDGFPAVIDKLCREEDCYGDCTVQEDPPVPADRIVDLCLLYARYQEYSK